MPYRMQCGLARNDKVTGHEKMDNIEEFYANLAANVYRSDRGFHHAPHRPLGVRPEQVCGCLSAGLYRWAARKQSEAGALVTNLLHYRVHLANERARRFTQLLDGTRTYDEICQEMAFIITETTDSVDTTTAANISAEAIHRSTATALTTISRMGLLIG